MWFKTKDGRLFNIGPGCGIAVNGGALELTVPGQKAPVVLESEMSKERAAVVIDRIEEAICDRRLIVVV